MRRGIKLSPSAEAQARDLIKSGYADGFTELVVRLIRDEFDRRGLKLNPANVTLNETGPEPTAEEIAGTAATEAAERIYYGGAKRRRRRADAGSVKNPPPGPS